MAYDKIIPVKSRLDHCVGYVLNHEKTDLSAVLDYIGSADKNMMGETMLETALNCRLETAYQDMMDTKRRWGKTGGVLGYHLIHSYAPGEVTPMQAHALGVEFARELLGERYEAVISTHLDRDHLHCHILFNSVSLLDGKKYRDNFAAYYGDIRGTSNTVSTKHGLSVIQPEGKDLFHLQKIYVIPYYQKSHLGKLLFQQAIKAIKEIHPGPCRMELNVNRDNPALGFYKHMGMRKVREGNFPIGNGYYMNDYIMGLDI